jgi:hypothetical protein
MSHPVVHRTDSTFRAHYLAEALKSAGIASFVDGAHGMASYGETGAGFPVHVRIRDRERLPEANRIVEYLLRSIPEDEARRADAQPWMCSCGQGIGAQFSACWKCGAERVG